MSRFVFIAFLLLILSTAARSQSVTGSWALQSPYGSTGLLLTIQSGNKVQFQLELQRGAPTFNTGFISGEFELRGHKGIFRGMEEYGGCEISFHFRKTKVELDTDAERINCGFGNGVIAQGTFVSRSKQRPLFSDGDPRLGK